MTSPVITNSRDLMIVLAAIEGDIVPRIRASVYQDINRYSLREGKIYGLPKDPNTRYRIVRIAHDSIVYKNLKTERVEYVEVDDLLRDWNKRGIKEISNVDSILEMIKKQLSPIIGGGLVAILLSWILSKI